MDRVLRASQTGSRSGDLCVDRKGEKKSNVKIKCYAYTSKQNKVKEHMSIRKRKRKSSPKDYNPRRKSRIKSRCKKSRRHYESTYGGASRSRKSRVRSFYPAKKFVPGLETISEDDSNELIYQMDQQSDHQTLIVLEALFNYIVYNKTHHSVKQYIDQVIRALHILKQGPVYMLIKKREMGIELSDERKQLCMLRQMDVEHLYFSELHRTSSKSYYDFTFCCEYARRKARIDCIQIIKNNIDHMSSHNTPENVQFILGQLTLKRVNDIISTFVLNHIYHIEIQSFKDYCITSEQTDRLKYEMVKKIISDSFGKKCSVLKHLV